LRTVAIGAGVSDMLPLLTGNAEARAAAP